MFYQRVNSLRVFTVNHAHNNDNENNEDNEDDDIGYEESSSEDDEKADKVNRYKMKLLLCFEYCSFFYKETLTHGLSLWSYYSQHSVLLLLQRSQRRKRNFFKNHHRK